MEWSVDREVLSTFPVLPNTRYDKTQAPGLKHPLLIGDFSLDEKRNFHHDNRSMGFIPLEWDQSVNKSVKFDLDQSMDKVHRRNDAECRQEKLTNLLSWILLNKSKFALLPASQQDELRQSTVLSHADKTTTFRSDPASFRRSDSAGPDLSSGKSAEPITSLSTDFVCYRGILRDIMCSPYDDKDGWIILATKFRGTIYLCGVESADRKEQKENETDREKQLYSWGFKFEHYMTEGSDPREGLDENKEYCCVLRSRLDAHSLLYAAEVDGVDSSRYAPPHATLSPFVELKTSREVTFAGHERTLKRFKFQKWWSQSYLVGIPRVVCGFRDDNGMVKSLQSYEVSSLPYRSREYWSKNIMINVVDKILEWVKEHVVVDDPKMVYKLTRKPESSDVMFQCLGDNSCEAFLPQWYVDKIFAADS